MLEPLLVKLGLFSNEYCKIFKSTYFEVHLREAAYNGPQWNTTSDTGDIGDLLFQRI